MSETKHTTTLPRWMMITWWCAALVAGACLALILAGQIRQFQATERSEIQSAEMLTELRSLNTFWRDLAAEQRARTDSLRAAAGR